MNPDHIPDLHWNVANTYHTTTIGYADTHNTVISTHFIDVETLSYARGDRCRDWSGMTSVSQSNRHNAICSIFPIT